ncbi:MAG: hypothetical protein L0H23_01090 [Luteimonas sp.]|nr:hypothetical protein [Luteimonas sp.]
MLEFLCAAPTWDIASWEVHVTHYASDTSVNVGDFSSRVLSAPGPVLLLQPIQRNSRIEIHTRVGGSLPVLVEEAYELAHLSQFINGAITAFNDGVPQVPLDRAAALMLMHKLDKNHMWAGNAKGYMWAADLSKGRGYDEQYADRLPLVLSILSREGLLVSKPSQGKKKWALNRARRADIYEIMRTQRFPDNAQRSLGANATLISARALDHCILPESR